MSLNVRSFPEVGTECYLRQYTGSYMVDMVKRPYTVIEVTPTKVVVQKCHMIPPVYHCTGNPYTDSPAHEGQRVWFYDTVAETILPDPNGSILELTWHPHRGAWGTPGRESDYPLFAVFGHYEHQPYLN